MIKYINIQTECWNNYLETGIAEKEEYYYRRKYMPEIINRKVIPRNNPFIEYEENGKRLLWVEFMTDRVTRLNNIGGYQNSHWLDRLRGKRWDDIHIVLNGYKPTEREKEIIFTLAPGVLDSGGNVIVYCLGKDKK